MLHRIDDLGSTSVVEAYKKQLGRIAGRAELDLEERTLAALALGLAEDRFLGVDAMHHGDASTEGWARRRLCPIERLEILNRISLLIQRTLDLEVTLPAVVEEVRKTFNCDRAFIFPPWAPGEDGIQVQFESTTDAFQGAKAKGKPLPKDDSSIAIYEELLRTDGPVVYDHTHPVPGNPQWKTEYGIKSQMLIAVLPPIGEPWVLGMHLCANERPWSEEERVLFAEIARRVSGALGNVLLYREAKAVHDRLADTQKQLLQSEKMACIGQLAAGVAHEINHYLGYVNASINNLGGYMNELLSVIGTYEKCRPVIDERAGDAAQEIDAFYRRVDLEFLRQDLRGIIEESKEGITRVKQIVQHLKTFSRMDDVKWQWVDIHDGIESTLNIVWNEIKYKAEVRKKYSVLPKVKCSLPELNQVFMNILMNAAHSIEEQGVITIETGLAGDDRIWIVFEDTGSGIDKEHLNRIFDPFFTTKPVGQGTGLGLALSYIIIQNHQGGIEVESERGRGTRFRITIPIEPA